MYLPVSDLPREDGNGTVRALYVPPRGHRCRRRYLRVMICGTLALMAAGAMAAEPASPDAAVETSKKPVMTRTTVVAEINGVKITYDELEKTLFERIPNITSHGTISPGHLRQRAFELLDQLIRDELVVQEANRLGIKVDRKKIDAEIARQRALFSSEGKFQEKLKQRGLTLAQFRQRIERTMLIQEVVDREVTKKVTVTDADMAAYFRDHHEKFMIPMQYRLKILLLPVDPSATPDVWEQERQRAIELRRRAQKGEDFADIVRQYSGDRETRDRGGDTGLIHHGQLGVGEVEDAVEPLKPGAFTDPVRTIYGFYLARVEEKRPGRQQTFEELNKELFRRELMEAKQRERYQEWMTTISSQAKITSLSPPLPAP